MKPLLASLAFAAGMGVAASAWAIAPCGPLVLDDHTGKPAIIASEVDPATGHCVLQVRNSAVKGQHDAIERKIDELTQRFDALIDMLDQLGKR